MKCLNCSELLLPSPTRTKAIGKKFCDNACQHEYQSLKKREDFLSGAWVGKLVGFPSNSWTRNLLKDQHGYKCAGCGISDEYNGRPITLEVNHKDGNALNNIVSNLEFLCPNCHSQTPNFRALNKNSARVKRRKRPKSLESEGPAL